MCPSLSFEVDLLLFKSDILVWGYSSDRIVSEWTNEWMIHSWRSSQTLHPPLLLRRVYLLPSVSYMNYKPTSLPSCRRKKRADCEHQICTRWVLGMVKSYFVDLSLKKKVLWNRSCYSVMIEKTLKLKGVLLLSQSQTACRSEGKDSNPAVIVKNPHLFHSINVCPQIPNTPMVREQIWDSLHTLVLFFCISLFPKNYTQ